MQTHDLTPFSARVHQQLGESIAGNRVETDSRSTVSCRINYCDSGRYGWGEMFWLHRGALAEVYEWRIDAERQHALTMSDCLLALFCLCGTSRLALNGHDSVSVNEAKCAVVLARNSLSVTRTFDAGYGQEIAVRLPLVVLDGCSFLSREEALMSTQMSDRMIESARAMLSFPPAHPLREVCIESHAWLLLGELLSSSIFLPKPPLAQSDQCRTRVLASRAADLLRAKPESSHTLDSIARAVGLSRSRLAEIFHQQYGSTVQAYLRQVRMERASKLVRSGQLAISEIAARVGYQDVSSFTRTFHRFHQITPAAMRRQHAV